MRDTDKPEIFTDMERAFRDVRDNPRYGITEKWRREQEVIMGMQEPRSSLDHYIGRKVESVSDDSFTLEGGIVVCNKDDGREFSGDDILGKVLLFVALSEMETRLQFGQSVLKPDNVVSIVGESWIELTPTKYTIAGMEGQTKEFYPQMPEELEDVLPPDPSSERIADGPQNAQEGAEDAQGEEDGEE